MFCEDLWAFDTLPVSDASPFERYSEHKKRAYRQAWRRRDTCTNETVRMVRCKKDWKQIELRMLSLKEERKEKSARLIDCWCLEHTRGRLGGNVVVEYSKFFESWWNIKEIVTIRANPIQFISESFAGSIPGTCSEGHRRGRIPWGVNRSQTDFCENFICHRRVSSIVTRVRWGRMHDQEAKIVATRSTKNLWNALAWTKSEDKG